MESRTVKAPSYRRILLKLSGESLMGDSADPIDSKACSELASLIHHITQLNVQVGIVIGGGNIFRGAQGTLKGMKRTPADHMGMLATLINGIALQQALENIGCPSQIMSAITLDVMAESYSWKKALEYLEKKRVLLFVGGTGNPYFSTDSAAALRALEIQADILIKATKVDGIYHKDPMKHSDAKKFDKVSYSEILASELKIMDATAIALCRDNQIPIQVLELSEKNLRAAIYREPVGTLVTGEMS